MADTNTIPITKSYGKALKINGDIDLAGVILTDVKMTPVFDTTLVEQGKIAKAAVRTLKSVDVTATATMLAATAITSIEAAIETFVSERVPSEGLAPAGGTTIVELGEVNILPGDAQTVSVKATYHPGMTPAAA